MRTTVDLYLKAAAVSPNLLNSLQVMMECAGMSQPLFIVSGSCQGTEVVLDQDSIPFGAVVQRSQSERRFTMSNLGDIGAGWVGDAAGRRCSYHNFPPTLFHPTCFRCWTLHSQSFWRTSRGVTRLDGARGKYKFDASMFEPEIFLKEIYCIEESTCDIVGIFRRPSSDSASGDGALLVPPRYAPAHTSKHSNMESRDSTQAKRAEKLRFTNIFQKLLSCAFVQK